MSDEFTVRWEVEDGYAGASAPQSFKISEFDIEPGATDGELEEFLEDLLQADFENNVTPALRNRDEALEWLRAKRDEKTAENL